MKAVWYEHRGPASEVLVFGETPEPVPGKGEVRIRLSYSGINPGDVKKRSGWQGSPMPFPRVIPHSDGAGVIDAVGSGVSAERIGQAVWCYGAQSYRAFGTAAEKVVVPDGLAVALPTGAASNPDLLAQAACLGIAGITGYRSVFADGSVKGLNVLVWGGSSGVGAIAVQMARRDGANVIAAVRKPEQMAVALKLGAHTAVLTEDRNIVAVIQAAAPDGVHRIADVDFAGHIDVNAAVIAIGGVIGSYFSASDRPTIPYWQLGFADVTLRLLGSDDFRPEVKARAAKELTNALVEGLLHTETAEPFPLSAIAKAHERVEAGSAVRVLLRIA